MSRFPERLETERLVLRPPTEADREELLETVTASYSELNEWLPFAKGPYGPDEAAKWIEDSARKRAAETDHGVLLLLKPTGQIVGTAGLHARDWDVPKFEIGYWLHTGFTGHGYATEAARELARYAFENLGARRVVIRADDRNQGSWAIAERLGFEWEATLKSASRSNAGELVDLRVYALFDVAKLR